MVSSLNTYAIKNSFYVNLKTWHDVCLPHLLTHCINMRHHIHELFIHWLHFLIRAVTSRNATVKLNHYKSNLFYVLQETYYLLLPPSGSFIIYFITLMSVVAGLSSRKREFGSKFLLILRFMYRSITEFRITTNCERNFKIYKVTFNNKK